MSFLFSAITFAGAVFTVGAANAGLPSLFCANQVKYDAADNGQQNGDDNNIF